MYKPNVWKGPMGLIEPSNNWKDNLRKIILKIRCVRYIADIKEKMMVALKQVRVRMCVRGSLAKVSMRTVAL